MRIFTCQGQEIAHQLSMIVEETRAAERGQRADEFAGTSLARE